MHEIELSSGKIQYTIVSTRPRQVRVILRVRNGALEVSAPKGVSHQDIRRIILQHEQWVTDQLQNAVHFVTRRLSIGDSIQFRGLAWEITSGSALKGRPKWDECRKTIEVPIDLMNTDIHDMIYRELRLQALERLTDLVAQQANRFELFPNKITIKEQARRWGSCSSKKNIQINWRLIQAPIDIQTYVVIHELAHLKEMNHSRHFWALVRSMMPDYELAKTWLKQRGSELYRLHESGIDVPA